MIKKPYKIVVFDLDETLGYFTEFGIFCDCLNIYFKNNQYSENNFNELLDLFPEFTRPQILSILLYLKKKKIENKCYRIMIYTNNQGNKNWALNIKKYLNSMVDYELFDHVIGAFKVNGTQIEMNRTSHNKTMDDFIKCTKLPDNIEIFFIDDVYHEGMTDERVYYINVKPYYYKLSVEYMMTTFLESTLGKDVINKEDFINSVKREFKKYNYNVSEKTKEEQYIDEIISKRILQHLKRYFYESNGKTIKKKQKYRINKSMKRTDKQTDKLY